MKTYALIEGLKQEYEKYTEEDLQVWKTLYDRQFGQLDKVAVSDFKDGLAKIGFSSHKIPDFKDVNDRLQSHTGWSIHVVPGIINEYDFFNMLAQKQFPSTTWLRRLDQLDYLPEPDMFHDAFGHMPLLSNETFCEFFQQLGHIGLRYINSPEALTMLGRIYWFTIEFGLITSEQGIKIYGAGILSSSGETSYSLSGKASNKSFDIIEIMHTHFDNDRIQDKYFVIEDFQQLHESLIDIEAELERVIAPSIFNKSRV